MVSNETVSDAISRYDIDPEGVDPATDH
jgi:hypothetical protein